jgi:hypothetical protein
MSWATAGGKELEMMAQALATGKDKRICFFIIPGFAWADVDLELAANIYLSEFTTGEMLETGGLSLTYALATGVLNFEGNAIAIGNNGCPQFAEVSLDGIFVTSVGAYSLATGPNTSYAITNGSGTTAVRISAHDSDFDKYGWFIFPPVANADISGTVVVKQSVFVSSYVSADGMTTANFGIVTGGEAYAYGDANLEGIRAKGQMYQGGQAHDGFGSIAYGHSAASFEGARGYTYNGRYCSYGDVGGMAVVKGYNNVTHDGNSVTITSKQSAFATTGNGGFKPPVD